MTFLTDHNFQISYSHKDDPLNNFYIPALKSSIQYDRSAGFFSSSALSVAAQGVAHLIQNNGKMRLLVGAELSEMDIEAIQKGHDLKEKITEKLLDHFSDPEDALQRERLEVLAWMIAEGNLEIKVVLPKDPNGYPIPAVKSIDYYHPKNGVFTDIAGNQIAFSGSINESETAWLKNFESFTVFFSWNETRPYLSQVTINFNHLWEDKEQDWIAIDIPEAVKNKLLKYRPLFEPTKDPYEKQVEGKNVKEKPDENQKFENESENELKEKIIFQYLRDIPYLIHNHSLAIETAAINPWPHQIRVVNQVLKNFPESALLCDEVGLGKTIEAGLIIRQLLLSGKVKKCLILAPKSVLRQWQEELYEKFGLEVVLYDGSKYWGVYDQSLGPPIGNPWEATPILLAGSQLAKRNDRQDQLLSTSGWDLLVVDEAHHARRKDFKEPIYRPNRLLSLINKLLFNNKITGLLLMTATPMQVHPLEVWDLLKLLGLGGKWGASEENFLYYFSEMKSISEKTDWDFIFDMLADEIKLGGDFDPNFKNQIIQDKGPVKWSILESAVNQKTNRKNIVNMLGKEMVPYIKEMASRHTPLRRYVFRNTRNLLREYERRGILKANVPVRSPKIVRVKMREDETNLYNRIDEYISHFYQKYENERRGLGFIMTIYRRRLTSSFYAICCSLERRLQYLEGRISFDNAYDDDDIEQDELSLDISDNFENDPIMDFLSEVAYLENFINELRQLSLVDSKLERLKADLHEIFKTRETVLVFTQYTDTMDYLREQLVDVYGSQLACYSGRGGEIWNGISWVLTTKEMVKNYFKENQIRIMLCTESASEGLNLQTCGVLVNYDMPWNPMRVEQRIGRIDRIGQLFKEIWIYNYFYQDTIEDIIYQRLKDRINWFEVVVGELQPILTEISELTRNLAMLPGQTRQVQIDAAINLIRQKLQNKEIESLDLDSYSQMSEPEKEKPAPINMKQLEHILISAKKTGSLFKKHPLCENAYRFYKNGKPIAVTFSADCFDKYPDSVQYLTYGNPILDEVLAMNFSPDYKLMGNLVRLENQNKTKLVAWFGKELSGNPVLIETIDQLQSHLENYEFLNSSESELLIKSENLFTNFVKQAVGVEKEVLAKHSLGKYLAEKDIGQRILLKAALIDIALGRQPELTDREIYPTGFSEQAIIKLDRYGYPWGALLQLAYEKNLIPQENDSFYQQIKDIKREVLKGKFSQLKEQAMKSVYNLNTAKKKYEDTIKNNS